ncbi:hypothetical protein [Rhodoferax sp.]|uniref:hypothetical protein n=1 Tax=Rhodoferax sp. TaxID=50421 RepID=UPI002729A9FD|nr:hypothetical protein [Rhodoferax sp.]MDP3192809.1 hypothetical protein [Rhodoferax sp.]
MKIHFFTVKFLLLSCLVGLTVFFTVFNDELMSTSINSRGTSSVGTFHAEALKPTQSFLQIIFASH